MPDSEQSHVTVGDKFETQQKLIDSMYCVPDTDVFVALFIFFFEY